ncbi:MAG: esterase [Rubrivivax sp.]|nr:esterase [Rubrivivax sp.]
MNFPGFLARRGRPALLAAAAALLVACGGGTSQVETFTAAHVVAFGDELSALTTDGRRYGVNSLTEAGAIDCVSQPIWVQAVAAVYGHVFAACNPNNVVDPKAIMRAAVNARVADLQLQIDTHLAAGGFGQGALATVLVGMHDVLDLYGQFPTLSRTELLAQARVQGGLAGRQVNRLVDLDVRVLIATVPDQGLTPYAIAQKAANTDLDRAALLSDLTTEFNAGLRTTILNDGRFVGLVLADEMVQAMKVSPSSFGLANVTGEACLETAPVPDCTTLTLNTGADTASWLWADDLRLAYGGQSRLGTLAATRARDNPF